MLVLRPGDVKGRWRKESQVWTKVLSTNDNDGQGLLNGIDNERRDDDELTTALGHDEEMEQDG